MKISFPSDSSYLAQTDFNEEGTNCTIKHISTTTMDDGKNKFILHVNQFDKGLVLNQTNGNALIAMYGDEDSNLPGKWINIYVDPTVGYGGKVTGGLRIRKPQRPQEDWNPDLEPAQTAYEPGAEG